VYVYGMFTMNGKQVKCIDATRGFVLEIEGQRYHVYAKKGTHVDLVTGSKREYIGKVNDRWTGDEHEAAEFILSYLSYLKYWKNQHLAKCSTEELIAELRRRGVNVDE